jgi:hypothetical protein
MTRFIWWVVACKVTREEVQKNAELQATMVSHGHQRTLTRLVGRSRLAWPALLLMIGISAAPLVAWPAPAGLVAAYGFNEGSGLVAGDASGNNHVAALVGGVTWTTTAISGNAIQLDGTTGHVSVSSPGMPTGDFTASVWVNLASTTAWQNVMEMLGPSSSGWELDLEPGGQLTLWTNGLLRFTTTATVPPNTWTYLTLRRQGSTWQAFINGVTQPQTGTDGTVFAFGSCPFHIGVDADIGCTGALNGYLQGRVDEVRVYSRVLSDTEIQLDMNTPVDGEP